ncbi:hypothetical protein SD70_24650 [Gordoniibacillus kamchatkensis]|uniref:Glycosyltransferase n=1 Tax=Gordoniibacillus kamchatkensis TaxID=1590651 RepID=A0ABR5ACU5_9BACL|nr:glycosyltransferase [Paenibacillus sp. VKM B-2647]KIL38722.1 hypothetical protein SD70_24650 [Paenibacillus sp. VKM B-2647]
MKQNRDETSNHIELRELVSEIQNISTSLEKLKIDVENLKNKPSISKRIWNMFGFQNLPIVSYSDDLKFSVDSLKVSNGKIYSYGWVFHRKKIIKQIRMLVYKRGTTEVFSVQYGNQRIDVAQDFQYAQAEFSGFIISGRIPKGKCKLFLELKFNDDSDQVIDLNYVSSNLQTKLSISKRRIKKAFSYLFRGKIAELIWKSKQIIMSDRKFNQSLHLNKFKEIINSYKKLPFILVIDHKMGGGANLYRQRLIEKNSRETPVLLLVYDIPHLEYGLTYYYKSENITFKLDSIESLQNLFESNYINVSEIFVNNLVSFEFPISVIKFIVNLKVNFKAQLIVPIHDYFCICPSFTLQDYNGNFCGIPDIQQCRICLPKNKGDFQQIVNYSDIDSWRSTWHLLLTKADKILCFSESSYKYIAKAYPDLMVNNIQIEPHSVDYLPVEKPEISKKFPMNIGILGNISDIKGANVIRKIIEIIEEHKYPIKVTVIGNMDFVPKAQCLTVTGSYKHSQLPKLIEDMGINIGFVPSIVPETFCYVVNELMYYDLPIATFSLGAQAERVSTYSKGVIIPEIDPSVALEELMKLYHEYYSNNIEEEIIK